jgi:uncharacterized protein (TIGR03066 family)
MKSLCVAVLGLATIFALTGSAKDDDTKKIVGKWEVTKSGGETPMGTLVDFQKDGKMTAVVSQDGKDLKLTGTYKFDGKKLNVDLMFGEDKVQHEFSVKFKSDDELELTNADGKVDTLKKKK